MSDRVTSGLRGHCTGLAAEDRVAAYYARTGAVVRHRRWRGGAGEIDLIVGEGDRVVFVEVKASRDFARAAERLTRRQAQRVAAAAEEFVGGEPGGSLTEMRFDLALVDRTGRIEVLRDVIAA